MEVETLKVNTTKKELDRSVIKSLAGIFEVDFKFAETFSPLEDYQYRDRHFSNAKEVALLIEDSENKISIQHILSAGNHVIKHWRQDWIFENREFLQLIKGHEWKKVQLSEEEVAGTWTQKVYQVDDSPRYEGKGTWVHVDGRHFWLSSADAALPRREISTAKRTDYNILRRHSFIETFEDGSWILEQNNEKIFRSEDNASETLICMERGLEKFNIKEYDPSFATDFWAKNKAFWAEVRQVWADFYNQTDYIKIKADEKLYFAQFLLASKFEGEKFNSEEARKEIKELLSQHVEGFSL